MKVLSLRHDIGDIMIVYQLVLSLRHAIKDSFVCLPVRFVLKIGY